jgi:hypothetical protein
MRIAGFTNDHLLAAALFYVCFFTFLFLTTADYVPCEHIHPDECLDCLAIDTHGKANVSADLCPSTLYALTSPCFEIGRGHAVHSYSLLIAVQSILAKTGPTPPLLC